MSKIINTRVTFNSVLRPYFYMNVFPSSVGTHPEIASVTRWDTPDTKRFLTSSNYTLAACFTLSDYFILKRSLESVMNPKTISETTCLRIIYNYNRGTPSRCLYYYATPCLPLNKPPILSKLHYPTADA